MNYLKHILIAGLIIVAGIAGASTITEILGTDLMSDSRTVINTNFLNLNTDKLETSAFGNDFYTYFTATTTDYLSEGSSNLYWTNDRFDSRLSGTSTLPNLTTVLGLTNASTTQLTASSDIWFTGLTNCDTIDTDANGLLSCGTDASGSGTGSNWQYETNFGANALTPTSTIPVWFKDAVYATSTIEADGSITTNTGFYGDYWLSSTGNSMAIQPTGDTDDFFSFKTPANRPTIKREGGKYIYVESSNVNDVGISFRKDADHSGTVNYYKDENLFGMTSKDPLVFKVCGDYDDYVKICSANNIPELSVASSSGFKINAGGTNSLLLNHDGGNVGIGTDSPYSNKYLTLGNGGQSPTAGATGLYIDSPSGGGIYMGDAGNSAQGKYEVYGGAMGIGMMSNHPLDLYTNNSKRMTILAGGNVGIGTTDPDTLLHINNSTGTSTVYAESTGAGFGGRVIMEDAGSGACTQQWSEAGLLFAEVVACP